MFLSNKFFAVLNFIILKTLFQHTWLHSHREQDDSWKCGDSQRALWDICDLSRPYWHWRDNGSVNEKRWQCKQLYWSESTLKERRSFITLITRTSSRKTLKALEKPTHNSILYYMTHLKLKTSLEHQELVKEVRKNSLHWVYHRNWLYGVTI